MVLAVQKCLIDYYTFFLVPNSYYTIFFPLLSSQSMLTAIIHMRILSMSDLKSILFLIVVFIYAMNLLLAFIMSN